MKDEQEFFKVFLCHVFGFVFFPRRIMSSKKRKKTKKKPSMLRPPSLEKKKLLKLPGIDEYDVIFSTISHGTRVLTK